jgi:hypothetical protein
MARLQYAINEVFETRKKQELPKALPEPPRDWLTKYAQLAKAVGLPESLSAGHQEASKFLDPVLGSSFQATWNPSTKIWEFNA